MLSTDSIAYVMPENAATLKTSAAAPSPHRPPTYAQNAWPQRYGKYSGFERSATVGSLPLRTASRSHIAVCVSTAPSDRYSARPSMAHSGSSSPLLPPAPSEELAMRLN